MQSDTKKYLAAAGILVVWRGFAFVGKTSVDGVIATTRPPPTNNLPGSNPAARRGSLPRKFTP